MDQLFSDKGSLQYLNIPEMILACLAAFFTTFCAKMVFYSCPDFFFNWLYRFVSSVLPAGMEDLKGTEVETIIKFKNALGIDDPDAANMHIEVCPQC